MNSEWYDVVWRSALVYLGLMAVLRFAGKRHIGQLAPHDVLLMVLVANAVQNAMVGQNDTLHGGMIAALTLIAINWVLSRFVLGNERLYHLLAGQPTLLIHNGQVLPENLRREGILYDELLAGVHEAGFDGPEQVKTAIQECDGRISVIGFGHLHETKLPPLSVHHRARRHHEHRHRR